MCVFGFNYCAYLVELDVNLLLIHIDCYKPNHDTDRIYIQLGFFGYLNIYRVENRCKYKRFRS